jgi:hypothetical protein
MSKPRTETPPKPRRAPDVELQALARLDRTMAELPAESVGRVLTWLTDKYSPKGEQESNHSLEKFIKPQGPPLNPDPDDRR